MDYLKSCSTNVHAIEDLASIRCRRLQHVDDNLTDFDQWTRIHNELASLRQQMVLCTQSDGHVYVFDNNEALDATLEHFQQVAENTLADDPSRQTTEGTPHRHLFLDALESSISFDLAQHESIVHVAPWTWIYSVRDDERDKSLSCLMKLHHRFGPNGTLILVTEIASSAWTQIEEPPSPNRDVIILPFSTAVRTLPPDSDNVLSDLVWKDSVVKMLASQGTHIAQGTDWIAVQDPDGTAFLWPSNLMLVAKFTGECSITDVEDDPESTWQSWFFHSGDSESFREPLTLAKEIFEDGVARAAQAESAKSGSDHVAGTAQMIHVTADNIDMTSPSLIQRIVDQQTAVAGIYPTPPDGVNQGPQTFQSVPATTPSVTQGEQNYSLTEQLFASDDSQIKGQDPLPVLDSSGFPIEQDELFGDAGEMEFADNDIGDADFSFFDEPDDEPHDEAMQASEMVDVQAVPDPQVQQANHNSDAVLETALEEDADQEVSTKFSMPNEDTHISGIQEEIRLDAEDDVSGNVTTELATQNDSNQARLQKPLDPFSIREHLLPPPVPASVAQNEAKVPTSKRRSGEFAPIIFRDGLKFGRKYPPDQIDTAHLGFKPQHTTPNINLPPTRKKSRVLKKQVDNADSRSDNSESEEDSYESSSDADENMPPRLPWDTKKRKRHAELKSSTYGGRSMSPWLDGEASTSTLEHSSIQALLLLKDQFEKHDHRSLSAFDALALNSRKSSGTHKISIAMDELFNLRKGDLLYIAQIIQEQACSNRVPLSWAYSDAHMRVLSPLDRLICETAIHHAINSLALRTERCDIGKLALTRDPIPPQRVASGVGKGPQVQARPHQRVESLLVGPDYFSLHPPFVKIRRGLDSWEMLSTCLSFWETLGLGPANGPKPVRAYCILPSNEDFKILMPRFMEELGTAYESCKLGSHLFARDSVGEEWDASEDGMVHVELLPDSSLEEALKTYAQTCAEFGQVMGHDEPHRTIVIYLVNPFPGYQAQQYLSACFWRLFKAYRGNMPKDSRHLSQSDVVLQILPVEAIATFGAMVVPDAAYMANLAREVYDRCPPSASAFAGDTASILPIFAAPSVELAGAAPKRIGFQLTPNPPGNLLHEGSILHLAYSCSSDRHWLTAAWSDNTGQYFATAAFSLRGRTFADGAEDVWQRTREIMATREVTWRIFVVATDSAERSILQCWRSLSAKPREQALCVTMLSVTIEPEVQLNAPDLSASNEQGFLTPASTPQAAAFTSSPDVNSQSNAPPTPAPSETPFSIAENDPDAHLIDVADETWGMMLSPKLTNLGSITGLANGMLFRRKNAEPQANDGLLSLQVCLHWTIQVKPSGNMDEGSIRQAELTLREVLRMYRNLSLLTKAKGLDYGDTKMAPLHVAAAMRGADGLDGML